MTTTIIPPTLMNDLMPSPSMSPIADLLNSADPRMSSLACMGARFASMLGGGLMDEDEEEDEE